MGLWRCQNLDCSTDPHGRCIFDFEAERPVCPKCGGDMRKNPNAVIELQIIHFEEIGSTIANMSYGTGELACDPGNDIISGTRRSSAPTAVTCKECRKTAAWRKAMQAHGHTLQDSDYPVEVDLAAGVHRVVTEEAAQRADVASGRS